MSYAIRFKGFALILNTVLPFALILGAALLCNALYSTAKSELGPPAQQIAAEVQTLAQQTKTTIQAAQTAASIVHTQASTAGSAVAGLVEPLTSFNVQVPYIGIPVPNGIECTGFKIHAPHPLSPPTLQPIPAGFHKFELRKIPVPSLPGLTPGFPQPGTPAPVLPRPALPGENVPHALTTPPGCHLLITDIDLTGDIGAAINQGLATAFAEPRKQITTIHTAIDTTLQQIAVLTPLAEQLRAQTTALAAHAQTTTQAYTALMTKVAALMHIASWCLLAVAIWVLISTATWALGRLTLGAHLLRHGHYP